MFVCCSRQGIKVLLCSIKFAFTVIQRVHYFVSCREQFGHPCGRH